MPVEAPDRIAQDLPFPRRERALALILVRKRGPLELIALLAFHVGIAEILAFLLGHRMIAAAPENFPTSNSKESCGQSSGEPTLPWRLTP